MKLFTTLVATILCTLCLNAQAERIDCAVISDCAAVGSFNLSLDIDAQTVSWGQKAALRYTGPRFSFPLFCLNTYPNEYYHFYRERILINDPLPTNSSGTKVNQRVELVVGVNGDLLQLCFGYYGHPTTYNDSSPWASIVGDPTDETPTRDLNAEVEEFLGIDDYFDNYPNQREVWNKLVAGTYKMYPHYSSGTPATLDVDTHWQRAFPQYEHVDQTHTWDSPAYFIVQVSSNTPRPNGCTPGNYYNGLGCIDALPGYFVDEYNAESQTACEPGNYSDTPASTECSPAERGYYVANAGADSQSACPEGTYQNRPARTNCFQATPGYYVDTTASQTQNECLPGSFQALSGQNSCELADLGYYVRFSGSSEQTSCPTGETTLELGATSLSDCVLASTAPPAEPDALDESENELEEETFDEDEEPEDQIGAGSFYLLWLIAWLITIRLCSKKQTDKCLRIVHIKENNSKQLL